MRGSTKQNPNQSESFYFLFFMKSACLLKNISEYKGYSFLVCTHNQFDSQVVSSSKTGSSVTNYQNQNFQYLLFKEPVRFIQSKMLERVSPSWHLNIYGDVSRQIYIKQTANAVSSKGQVGRKGLTGLNGRSRQVSHPQPKPQKQYKEQFQFQLFDDHECSEQLSHKNSLNLPASSNVKRSSKSQPTKATAQQHDNHEQKGGKPSWKNTLRSYTKRHLQHPCEEATNGPIQESQFSWDIDSPKRQQGSKNKGNSPKKGKDQLKLPNSFARLRLSSSEECLPSLKSPKLKRTLKLLGTESAQIFANKSTSCEHINKHSSFPSEAMKSTKCSNTMSISAKQEVHFTNYAGRTLMDKTPGRESEEFDDVFLPNTMVTDKLVRTESRRTTLENQLRKHALTDGEMEMFMIDIVEPIDLVQMILKNN